MTDLPGFRDLTEYERTSLRTGPLPTGVGICTQCAKTVIADQRGDEL